jgi:D-tyrosyl-tRNA(Tyr) deacylase
MRAVVQRVSGASVKVDGQTVGQIENGLLVLLGVTHDDTPEDAHWLAQKIVHLRVFNDEDGKMNLNLKDAGGKILVVSQFTLYADCRKGHRPSFTRSAPPEIALPLYENFLKILAESLGYFPQTGIFGAMMEVTLTNHGPVTVILDSKQRNL